MPTKIMMVLLESTFNECNYGCNYHLRKCASQQSIEKDIGVIGRLIKINTFAVIYLDYRYHQFLKTKPKKYMKHHKLCLYIATNVCLDQFS